ncbi:unnamed protein product, partial [Staurois parvus]
MQGPVIPDIVNAGSGETRDSDLMNVVKLCSLGCWIIQSCA